MARERGGGGGETDTEKVERERDRVREIERLYRGGKGDRESRHLCKRQSKEIWKEIT